LAAASKSLILLTCAARAGSIRQMSLPTPDAAFFVDCDMAILGAEPNGLDAYDAAIAVEYKSVPADAYRAGRRAPRIARREAAHLSIRDVPRAIRQRRTREPARAIARLR
jgi:predicted metal-dependent HD superfamily phosphohydrolase